MIDNQVVNRLIFQPKHMLSVLKRTIRIRRVFTHQIINLNPMSLEKQYNFTL